MRNLGRLWLIMALLMLGISVGCNADQSMLEDEWDQNNVTDTDGDMGDQQLLDDPSAPLPDGNLTLLPPGADPDELENLENLDEAGANNKDPLLNL